MTSKQLLRKLRQRAFDYPPEKDAQLARCMGYLKSRMFRDTKTYRDRSHDTYLRVMWM